MSLTEEGQALLRRVEINVERDAMEKQHDADAETFRLWQKIRAEGRLTITEEDLKID